MSLCDSTSLKTKLPVLFALLAVAQIDLASAFGWPQTLLSLIHLTAAHDDLCQGVLAGIGASIDVLVLIQLARIFAKRNLQARQD